MVSMSHRGKLLQDALFQRAYSHPGATGLAARQREGYGRWPAKKIETVEYITLQASNGAGS
jgi:hypothetical protein